MPTRRSFLTTGLATTSVAIAGCSGLLESDGGSGTTVTTAMASDVVLGTEIDGVDVEVDHSSSWALRIDPRAYASAAAQLPRTDPNEWMAHASLYLPPVAYSTTTPDSVVVGNTRTGFEETGSAEARYAVVRGGTTGETVRSELDVSGTPDETFQGFELYYGEEDAWAVSDADLVGVPTAGFRNVEDSAATRSALKASTLRRLVRIVAGERTPTGHARAAMDAVDHDDFLGVGHQRGWPGEEPPNTDVFAYGLGADEVTYQIAVAAPNERAFDAAWDGDEVRGDLTSRPLARDRSPEVITDGPTVSANGTLGHGSVTLPTSDAFVVVG